MDKFIPAPTPRLVNTNCLTGKESDRMIELLAGKTMGLYQFLMLLDLSSQLDRAIAIKLMNAPTSAVR